MTVLWKSVLSAALAALMTVCVALAAQNGPAPTAEPAQAGKRDLIPGPTLGATQTEYPFRVVDQDGAPVEGVYVQFCNDAQCMISPSDAEGLVAFVAEPGAYSAHLLMTPEGYMPNTEEFELTEGGIETVFTLIKESGGSK